MARYRYRAVAGSGDTVEGEMEAPSQAAVVKRLQAEGHLPIRAEAVDEAGPSRASSLLHRDLFRRTKPSRQDIVLMTREIATLLRAGLSLERSLEILNDLAEGGPARRLIDALLQGIRGGASFADSLSAQDGAFPDHYVSMVRAGEAGGTLEVVLERLSDVMERAQATRESIRTALIYPAILIAMAAGAVAILLGVVVPRFRPLFEDAGAALPASTQVVVFLGDIVENYWWLLLIAALCLVALGRQLLRDRARRLRWDRWVARSPVIGDLVIKAEIARLTRTLGTLVANGVNLLPALQLARDAVGNTALAADLADAERSLKEGQTLTAPLMSSGIVPRLAVHLTRVGEETGELEAMFLRIADIYDEEVSRAVDRMLALLVPALTIFLGLIIAGIIGSILAAILSVYDLPI